MSFKQNDCGIKARRPQGRRAFSLVEMASVIAIVALVAAAGFSRFGSSTLENLSADGFARRLALDLMQARRRTIATGDNHFLQFTAASGNVTDYTLYRRTSGGNLAVDEVRFVPAGVNVTTSHTTLEFDFDGAALAGYSVAIAGPQRSWTVSTTMVAGAVRTVETTP
jgi:prepilin-type N-terminal cleavage/methylation domain-containing protein